MNDRYADGFLDGWAAAIDSLRARFDLIPREPATEATINGERSAGLGGHSDPPEGKPWLVGPQEQVRHQHATVAQELVCGCFRDEQILREAQEQIRAAAPFGPCVVHLMVAGACMHCGWEMP